MEQDFKRLGVGSQNDEFCNTTIQSLGGCETEVRHDGRRARRQSHLR